MTVYIISATRTGSTMLDLMLASNKDVTTFGELMQYGRRKCAFCGVNCNFWKAYEQGIMPGGIIIDSSKKVEWVAKHYRPGDKIIQLIRNGFDRLLTYKERFGKVKAEYISKWVRKEKKIHGFLKDKDHIIVKYEDVCEGDGLKQCCDYLGIEHKPEMKEYWKHEHHGLPGSKKTYALVKAYHKRPLDPVESKFVKKHGFNTNIRKQINFMNKEEQALWAKHGEKFNRKMGYE